MQRWFGEQLGQHGPTEHWSNAPTPSTDNTVAVGLASVKARITCTTQSVPALVERANWNGAHARSTSLLNCLARLFATNGTMFRWQSRVAVPLQ